ncbi:ABC transporter permease [Williamsia sp. 1135]|uniref:ABC transporter permease n=1 Tax=Williamsia sp. 1135 TaxID=1889262 RepID=UPI000A112EBB|nr:ABC transporter permease [Williamsia sp. 1135]ORM27833.1 molybdenum ABC transporter permease subunit [Williamsia sp. 1135]
MLPPIALAVNTPWDDFWGNITSQSSLDALKLSLRTAAVSTVLCIVLGVPMAIVFARRTGMSIRVLRSVVLLPLVLPPVVGGIGLLYAFGKFGLVGEPLSSIGIDIAFSTTAVILAQTFVALPFLVISLEGALRSVGSRYEQVAATLGASPTRTLWKVTMPLVFPALLSGMVLAFARALGEFGATITFAGNLQGVTQTAPLAIYVESISEPEQALPLSIVLVVVALLVVIAVHVRDSKRAVVL